MSGREEKKKLRLEIIDPKDRKELRWLHAFIHRYHSSPKWVLPSLRDLDNPAHRYFKAVAVRPKKLEGKIIGISSYEIRTQFLIETQKTIIDPRFRGQGWGQVLSLEVEMEARRQGYKKIRSAIYADNLAMLNIKLAQGFIIEGFHPDHDAPGLHEYSLGKVLK